MGLREYQQKRDFARTPEPAGKERAKTGFSYVIQKHDASHLHYDFRLELDGVLKSWAVPKGPSLDPSVKRLAMQVEDHPVDYGSFEGIIPKGEYGGGTVMLWDHGEWEPVGDAHAGFQSGKLKFKLHGEKLHGQWMLVRTSRGPRQWLLFKERDDHAQPTSEGDVLEELPLSVTTGRTLDAIAADQDRVWGTNGKVKQAARPTKKKKTPAKSRGKLPGKKASLPRRVDVQLATLTEKTPDGEEWVHEIKFDGYRIVCRIDRERVDLLSRNHKNWTDRMPGIAEAMRAISLKQAIFDGEVVALRADGVSDFQELQNAFQSHRAKNLYYYVFDLLHLDGHDLTGLPLIERKRLLAEVLADAPGIVRASDHIEGGGPAFFEQASKAGLEGIISKRADSQYIPGRGYDWLKIKCVKSGEFVIGGFTDPSGSRSSFGALLVGYHDANGDLTYAGKVGTGFGDHVLNSLGKQLHAIKQDESPFVDRKRAVAGVHWVAPHLVAQIVFGSRTRDGYLRHASFQGLREDKAAQEVTSEKPMAIKKATAKRSRHAKKDPATAGVDYDTRKQLFDGVRLTSPDKVLYPGDDITKLELADYYRRVAAWIMPYIKNRPLVLVRCPDGLAKACFYQKHPGQGTPSHFRQIEIEESKKTENYLVIDDVAGLISVAQVGALEIHAWGSREDMLERPDRLIFDLDPDPELPWKRVIDAARQVRQFLADVGLETFVKTTGGKGLHLVAPVDRRHDWEEVRAFCNDVADLIAKADPRRYTANMAKVQRTGKIYIDYVRNTRGATAIVPFSTRARPGAPVSVPLAWDELTAKIPSNHFTIRNLDRRLVSLKRDPWQAFHSLRQTLTGPIKKLEELRKSLHVSPRR